MKFEMRELRGDDLFPLIHILGKLDITDDFVALYGNMEKISGTKEEVEKLLEERGMKVVARVLKKIMLNLQDIKGDLNAFLAELCGVKTEQIKELGLKDYTALVVSFFKKPELLDFFKSIASFMA